MPDSSVLTQRLPKTVPLMALRLSRFNARRTRPSGGVTALAERMQRNGFEVTRALWVYPCAENMYEVFAGGTRLAAAREAAIDEVPVLVHEGYDDAAISRLADEDNENDEYHVPVPLPDVWEEYRRLKEDEGWTQQVIAKAKVVEQADVSRRIRYAAFPKAVSQAFMKNDFLRESHALELLKLCDFHNCTPWLTRDLCLTEILADVLGKHRGQAPPTASVFAKAVDITNSMLTVAQDALATFPTSVEDGTTSYHPHKAFLAALAAQTVRTTKDVLAAALTITTHLQTIEQRRLTALAAQQRRLTREQEETEKRTRELAEEQQRHAYRDSVLACYQQGDCRTLIPQQCPSNIRLVLTDPPYGKQFQSHRRVTSAKKAVVPGDTSVAEAAALLKDMLAVLVPKLAEDAHLFIFTHQDSYAAFCQVVRESGLSVRRTMTWIKGNHGLGDTTRGEALTETEWILHAVRGNPKLTDNVDRRELLDFPGTQDSAHPMEKPLALLTHLIERGTDPGDIVVDPFAGTANTLLALLEQRRWGWACEIDPEFYQEGAEKLYQFLQP